MLATTRRFLSSTTVLPAIPHALSKAADVRRRITEQEAAARLGGGEERKNAQHSKGKLMARERLDLLLDEGSFREYDMLKTRAAPRTETSVHNTLTADGLELV